MHLGRLDAQQLGVEPDHHQPLDVVGIAEVERLAQCVGQARHRGVPRPVEAGQIAGGLQRVRIRVARHLRPVHPAHVLAPAEDLADVALGRRQRHAACTPRGFHRIHDLARAQQLEVQRRRDLRVPQPRRLGPQRILPAAEGRQALVDEPGQRIQRLRARHRPGEALQPAGMTGKARRHQRKHFARDRIGLDPQRRL